MKVIILCTQLEAGGAQRAAIRLCAELKSKGIDCENWFLYKKREIFLDAPNIRLMLPRNITSKKDYILAITNLYKNLQKEKPDVVLSFTHYSNIVGQLVAKLCGVKTRVASHRNLSYQDMSRFLRILDKANASLGIYTGVTAVSASTKNSLRYYPKRIFDQVRVIHNGLSYIPARNTKIQSREQLNLPTDVPLIGAVGRLSLQKNHKLLLEAIKPMNSVHLAIVGEGELREELKQFISDNNLDCRVHLLGEISFNLIPDFLKALDVFVMPSLYEGLSNALVEALKAGLPVIASDVESQKDVIISESGYMAGVLLPVNDPDVWSHTIDALISNTDKLSEMSQTALKRGADFSMENMVQGFVEACNINVPQ